MFVALYSYSATVHKKHTLFCGTKAIQVKAGAEQEFVYGVVSGIGFSTAKVKRQRQ